VREDAEHQQVAVLTVVEDGLAEDALELPATPLHGVDAELVPRIDLRLEPPQLQHVDRPVRDELRALDAVPEPERASVRDDRLEERVALAPVDVEEPHEAQGAIVVAGADHHVDLRAVGGQRVEERRRAPVDLDELGEQLAAHHLLEQRIRRPRGEVRQVADAEGPRVHALAHREDVVTDRLRQRDRFEPFEHCRHVSLLGPKLMPYWTNQRSKRTAGKPIAYSFCVTVAKFCRSIVPFARPR
jgi:hypothetical protein